MLRVVTIEGFRGFQKLTLDLAPVSVVLGPNSSGKSSVLQAVRLACAALAWTFRRGPEPKLAGDWIVIWWDWPVDKHEEFLPAMPVEDLFLNHLGNPLVITLRFDDTDFVSELRVSLRYGRSDALRLDVRVKSETTLGAVGKTKPKTKNLSAKLADALSGKGPIAVTVPAFYGVVREEAYVNDARLERLLGSGEQGNVIRNLVGRLGGLKEINDVLLQRVRSQLTSAASGQALQEVDSLKVHFRDKNGGALELSSAGTGLVALTALFAALQWYGPRVSAERPLIFLLDEPEAHLHPRLQADTGERIAELVERFGAQALLATHSVEMINRLGRRDGAVLWSIDRTASIPAVQLTTENEILDGIKAFCDLSAFAGLNLLRNKRVVFHEGKTDRDILDICAAALFRNDPTSHDKYKRWTFSELSSETNADAKDVFRRALAPLVDKSERAEKVRIVRILDRDLRRNERLGPTEERDGIEEFDVVWSRYSIESIFLEPTCLAAWIHLALRSLPASPSLQELEVWVKDGITSANADVVLLKDVSDRLLVGELGKLTAGQSRSEKHVRDAIKAAEDAVKAAPDVYQNGKKRAEHVLKHVREQLPTSIQNRVKRDIPEVLRAAQTPSVVGFSQLVPREIEAVLKYMAS